MKQPTRPDKASRWPALALYSLMILVAITPVCAADEAGSGSVGAKIIEIEGLVEAGMPGAEARVMRQGDYVEVGEEVTVRRGSMVTLALVDGKLRRFTGPTTLTIGHDLGRSGGTVVADLTAAVTDMLFGTELQSSEAVMATRHVQSTGEMKITVPVLIHPAPGEQLLDKPREFRWMSVQSIPLYRVSIYNSSEMMWQGTVSDTKATCPPRTCDFRSGETCYWVVEALVGNTTLRSEAGDFAILDRDRQANLYKALEETDASVTDARMASLLKARLCTDARVFTKALEVLDDHLRQRPDRSAYLLRAQIRETMGLTESAITDYKRAMALPPAE